MLRPIGVLLVLLLLCACRPKEPATPQDIGKELMPKGATMVVVGRDDTNPKKWVRSFTTPAAYPALALGDETFAHLRAQGWKRCTGLKDEWANYVDRSRKTVYQRRQVWIRPKEALEIQFQHSVDPNTGDGLLAQRVTLSFDGAQSAEDLERKKTAYAPCDG